MFTDNMNRFRQRVIASFERVRNDVNDFKRSVTDWILYLDSNQRDMQLRVAELEKEVKELRKQRMLVYN